VAGAVQDDGEGDINTITRPVVPGDPELVSVRIILNRGIILAAAHAGAVSRYMNVSVAIQSYSRGYIATVRRAIVAGYPHGVSVRVILNGGILLAPSHTRAGSGHINVSFGIQSQREGVIATVPRAIVTGYPEGVPVRAVLYGGIIRSAVYAHAAP